MKYTLQQADDLARKLKKTRKGRKFLKDLLNFHEKWQDFAKEVAADATPTSKEEKTQRDFPATLKSLAAELDSNFQTTKKNK